MTTRGTIAQNPRLPGRAGAVSGHGGLLPRIRFSGLLTLVLLVFGSGLGLQPAHGQLAALEQVRRSFSGQFIVSIVPPKGQKSRMISNLETNAEYIRLDPTLLPVSCERIKQDLARELGLNAPWSGKIFISLYNTGSADDPALITSAQFRNGWQYRVELPDIINRARYVRAIVQVLLLETANRTALEHSAEIPTWLTEGLSQQVLLSSKLEVILPPPRSAGNGFSMAAQVINARKENPLEIVHKKLSATPPLTFQQLSFPEAEQLEGAAVAAYPYSAFLFVDRLLELKEGRACLREMLSLLPQHYNWQFAFLQAFRSYFQRPLDVEKWWTLHVEHFTGRELAQTWPADESWQKLDELVRSMVQVRTGTNQMPLHAEVKLQTIVSQWDRAHQDQALRQKLAELQMLRLRLAPDLVPLSDEYSRTLANYLQNRDHGGLPLLKKTARRHTLEQTVQRLDELDARRLELRPLTSSATIQASSRGH